MIISCFIFCLTLSSIIVGRISYNRELFILPDLLMTPTQHYRNNINNNDVLVLPPALMVSNFSGCCGSGKTVLRQTCLTESACTNPFFPYSNEEESIYLKPHNHTKDFMKKEKKIICEDAANTLQPKYEWCKKQELLPIPSYPFGCGKHFDVAKSGPYHLAYLFTTKESSSNTNTDSNSDSNSNLLFCGIPKVGITQWLQFLRFVNFDARDYQASPHYKSDRFAYRFQNLPLSRQTEIWYNKNNNNNFKSKSKKNWTKMIFIREPTERLLSAYIDKIKPHYNITFTEFVDFLDTPNITKDVDSRDKIQIDNMPSSSSIDDSVDWNKSISSILESSEIKQVKKLRKMVLLSLQLDESDKSSKKLFKKAIQNMEELGKVKLKADGTISLINAKINKKKRKSSSTNEEDEGKSKKERKEKKLIFEKYRGLSWYTDPHWRPQAWTCGISEELPNIDYISTLDYIAKDTKNILQKVNLWDKYGQHYRTVKKKKGGKNHIASPPPPEPLRKGQLASGFQQPMKTATDNNNSNSNNMTQMTLDDPTKHNHNSKSQMNNYYTPELLDRVRKLYWMDVLLYDAIMDVAKENAENSKDQIPTGKAVAMKIKSECSF